MALTHQGFSGAAPLIENQWGADRRGVVVVGGSVGGAELVAVGGGAGRGDQVVAVGGGGEVVAVGGASSGGAVGGGQVVALVIGAGLVAVGGGAVGVGRVGRGAAAAVAGAATTPPFGRAGRDAARRGGGRVRALLCMPLSVTPYGISARSADSQGTRNWVGCPRVGEGGHGRA